MEDIISIIMPLFAVVAVIAGAYIITKWVAKRHNNYSSGRHIKIIERVVLGKDTYLVIAKVGLKTYLLSMTSQRVEMLSELDEDKLPPIENEKQTPDFLSILTSALGKKTNKNQTERVSEDKWDGSENEEK